MSSHLINLPKIHPGNRGADCGQSLGLKATRGLAARRPGGWHSHPTGGSLGDLPCARG